MTDKVENQTILSTKIQDFFFQKDHGRRSQSKKRVEGILVLTEKPEIFLPIKPLPKEIFHDIDQDQSGSVTQLELYKFIVRVHKMEDVENTKVDWNEVKTIFKSLDKDGDRCVDWEEFFVKLEIFFLWGRAANLTLSGCCHQQGEWSQLEEPHGEVHLEETVGEIQCGGGEGAVLFHRQGPQWRDL